ncbi:MAG: PAS domain S-box protein [Myxococcota bacterium]
MIDQGQQPITGHLDILDALPIMILDVDRDGLLQFANKKVRERLGLPTELDEIYLHDVLDPSSASNAMDQVQALFAGEGDITSTWKLKGRNGNLIQVDANAVTIYSNGYPVRVRTYLHDGSQMQALQAAPPPPPPPQLTVTGSADAIAALKEEQEYTKALLLKSGLMVYIVDTHNIVVDINDEMFKATGFNRANAPTLDALLTGLYPDPKYRFIVQGIHQNMYKNQHLRKTELTVSTSTGEVRHVSWSTARLKNARGQVHGFIAMGIDVTEKKRLEQWVKLQTSCFDRVYDSVVVSDLQGNIINWIGGSERMLGFKSDEMVGKPLAAIFLPEYRNEISASLKEGIDREGKWSTEMAILTSENRKLLIRLEAAVILNEKGTPIAIVSVLHDLTRERQLERDTQEEKEENAQLNRLLEDRERDLRELRLHTDDLERRIEYLGTRNRDLENENSRRAAESSSLESGLQELSLFQTQILNTSSMAVLTLDASGHVMTWSRGAEELTRLTDKEAFMRHHDEVMRLEEFDWEGLQSEASSQGRVILPSTLVRRDGSKQPVQIEVTVDRDGQGNPTGYTEVALPPPSTGGDKGPDLSNELLDAQDLATLGALSIGLARDMSDAFSAQHANLRRLQEYVTDLKKVVELYRSGVSHRDIESYVRRVDLKRVLSDLDFVFDETSEGVVRLRDLTADFHRSMPGAGARKETLNLNEVAESATAMVRADLQNRARLERQFGEPSLGAGNAGELTRAVVNGLLAVLNMFPAASVSRNEVKLVTQLDGPWATVELSHNGPVLDEGLRQLDDLKALVQSKSPVGLHLAVAQRLLQNMGGRLELLSHGGTESLVLRVPAVNPEAPLAGETERPSPSGNYLFIDDDKNQLRAYRRFFERYHNVFQADNADDALNVLNVRHDFTAVIMDLLMPQEDGLKLVQQVVERFPQVKQRLILLVPPGTSHDVRSKLSGQARLVLGKPVELSNLQSVLTMLSGGK